MKLFVQNKIIVFLVKHFRFALAGIVIILLFISFYFLLMPKYNKIQEEGGLDYGAKLEILESKKKELGQLKELRKELSKVTSSEMEKLEKILPSSKELPDIFLQMENLARESGLKVTRISISEGDKTGITESNTDGGTAKKGNKISTSAKTSGIGTITVSLSVAGPNTYQALKTFLDSIEDNMRIVDVNSLTYSSGSAESQEETTYSVNLKTYYLQ